MRALFALLAWLCVAGTAVAQMPPSAYGPQAVPGCPLAGCTYTGAVTLNAGATVGTNTGFNILAINGQANSGARLYFQSAGVLDWIEMPNGSRSGANAGDNLEFWAFADDGSTFLGVPLSLKRATLAATFGGLVTAPSIAMQTGALTATNATSFQSVFNVPSVTGTNASGITYNQFTVGSDNSATPNNAALGVSYTFGGGSFSGGAAGLSIGFTMNAISPTSAGKFFIAENILSTASASAGGTNTGAGALGAMYGINISNKLLSGATNYSELTAEIDSEVDTGASVAQRSNIKLILAGSHAVQGVTLDAMINIGRQRTATAGALNGLLFGDTNDVFPIDNTSGSIIGVGYGASAVSGADIKAKYGVNVAPVSFASSAWQSAGAIIDPSGFLLVGPNKISWTTTGLTIDAPGQVGGTPAIVGGGTGWVNGQTVNTGNGDLYTATVSAGVITALTPVVKATTRGSPPANPLTVLGDGGSGATVNITWAAASGVNIAGSSAKLGFYGATAIVKATPTGACAGNTGCQALRDALGNLGLIVTGSITN